MPRTKYKRNNNNKAIVYCRYSSHSQNEASIEQQLDAAREYAKKNKLVIIKEYCDAAMTGTNDDRPNFNLMLSEVNKLKPSFCICWKGDRLSRNRIDAALTKHHLKSAGCFPVYVTENIDTETPEGDFLDGMLEVVSSFYVAQTIANVERGMNHNAKNCLSNGSKKYGYTTDNTKHYVINPEEAEIVKYIFQQYSEGTRPKDIAAALNERGVKTLQNKNWRNDSITKIIKNPTYKGIYIWSGHYTEGGMPRIIEDDLWNRCNEILISNKHHKRQGGKDTEYYLVPKLFCDRCGGLLSGAYGKSATNKKAYYYYRCTNKECKTKNINKAKIENAVKDILKYFLNNRKAITEEAIEIYTEHLKENGNLKLIENLEARIEEATEKQSNLLNAIEQGLITESTKNRLLEIDQELNYLNEQLEIEKSKLELSTNPKTIKAFMNKYTKANFSDIDYLKQVIEHYVLGIYANKESLIVALKYSPDEELVAMDDINSFANLPASKLAQFTDQKSSSEFSAPPPIPTRSNQGFDLRFCRTFIFCKGYLRQ